MPTFGVDTIRKFDQNTSEMKKLGALNFEDILQVRMKTVMSRELCADIL